MVHYICKFQLVNVIKDFFFISYIMPARKPLSLSSEIFQSFRHRREKECVCCTTQYIKQQHSILFTFRIKVIDMLGKIILKN